MIPTGRRSVAIAALLVAAAAACVGWGTTAAIRLSDVTLLLSAAVTVMWLFGHPLRIQPHDELTLVVVPVLVALGVGRPLFALGGALLGLGVAALVQPHAWNRSAALVAGVSLSAGVVAGTLLPIPAIPLRLGPLVVAAVVYMAVRTLLVAARTVFDERMAWRRAFSVAAVTITTSLATPVVMALVSVVIERLWLPQASRLALSALPLLAGAVVLQVFQPYAQRGREEERGRATTAMFADAMDVKDTSTGIHSRAVAQLSRQIARAVGVDEQLADRVYLTGLLHDVGKVAVPDEILQKPGHLGTDEWRIMQAHVFDGATMVASIAGLSAIAPLVRASHEHYDGSGYPDGLKGREIPLASRIVAIADAYHALTNDRAYRSKRDIQAAFAEIDRCAGAQFDPNLVQALRAVVLGGQHSRAPRSAQAAPPWLALLRRPAFALLWGGELVSFLGDEVFFIAITLWVYTLTGSAAILAVSLAVGYAAQAAFSFLAGVVADRVDRRIVVVLSDIGRALVVAALPFVLPRSLPAGFTLLAVLSIGSVFFRASVNALLPSIATRDELPAANALFETTERIAEVAGGVLGAFAVVALGYSVVMFAEAASFVISAACVLLMPLAWGAGLGPRRRVSVKSDLVSGLRYLWQTPFQRYFALLIIPGYLTLAFDTLKAPMVVHTAHLSAEAYGVVNSALGAGRLLTAVTLAGLTRRWATQNLAVVAYLLGGVGIAIFAATPWYVGLVAGAFVYSIGNMLSRIVNATIIMQVTPLAVLGRTLGNRQGLIRSTQLVGILAFGRFADVTSPPAALWLMATLTIGGVLVVWASAGRSPKTFPQAALPEIEPVVAGDPL
jgi:HD-GYP domain-containing protein (c-di-GMP phosphodiesterase class II)